MLTPKQKELLNFIHCRIEETGVPPSFDEMKEALQLKSKSGIHRLITALEERGFIRRLAHRARALEIVKLPDAMKVGTPKAGQFKPSVIHGGGATLEHQIPNTATQVPMMGKIAAGVPISAIQDHSHDVPVPADMLGRGEHFALEVTGDSMIEAGILDGDLAILRRVDNADNGDVVVALIDDQEATLKRLRKRGGSVALEAANPDYETRIFGPDRVRIQGRLIGLLRRY